MVADVNTLRQVMEAHCDPVEMAVLIGAPLPEDIGEVLALLGGQPERLHPAAEYLGVSPDGLLVAVRHYVREVMLHPESDDARMLGMTFRSGPEDLKQNYRALQSWLHPDREGAPEDAVALSAQINAAWSRLRAVSRIPQTSDELIEFRPRWRKIELHAERPRRRWIPVTATVAILLILGAVIVTGPQTDERRTQALADPDPIVAIDSHEVAQPVPEPETSMPVPSSAPAPSSAETEALDTSPFDALVEALPREPAGAETPGAATIAAAGQPDAVEPVSSFTAAPVPDPVPPQPVTTRPATVATGLAPVSEPAAMPVAVSVAAETRSPSPADEAPAVSRKHPSIPADDPVTTAMPQDAFVVAQAPEAPTFQDAVLDTPPPSSRLPAATAENGVAESSQGVAPAAAGTMDPVRTDRARVQGTSVLEYLTRRKSNAPPVWHSGSAFDQAEQARRTLTAGRGARPARPLYELEHWQFGAHHAEARIPVEPSDRRLDTQIVSVRMLWKNDDWWVENIGLETAK